MLYLKNTVDKRFVNNMQSIGAHQMINLPTRFILHQKPSLLDHIYCNDFVHELQPGVLQYDISDHHSIFLLAKIVPKQINEKGVTNNSTQKILRCTYQQNWKKILPATLRIQMKNSTTFLKYSNPLWTTMHH